MNITNPKHKQIKALAEALHPIIPANSFYKGYSLKQIAKDTNTTDYYKSKGNKQKTLEHYLENLFRYHKQKSKTVIIKIVEKSVPWLSRQRSPLTEEMKQAIIEPMRILGFKIGKELEAIRQPPLENISIPSSNIASVYDRLGIHPLLGLKVKKLFKAGHTNEAIRKSMEIFEKLVRDLTGDREKMGNQLMNKAFSGEDPRIKMTTMQDRNEINEQKGYCHLAMGAMSCFPKYEQPWECR